MSIQIAIDIGGTFTDVIAIKNGEIATTKVPTTPDVLVNGVKHGIDEILKSIDGDRSDVSQFIHGTTVGTNAIIERDGGTVGLLMTEGFRDTLAIGRQNRKEMYDLFLDQQTPTFLAPRQRRIGIEERIGPDGNILTPLDEGQVVKSVEELVEDHEVDSIGICYLFSFENPKHELRTEEIINEWYPEVFVSRSSRINPAYREYERLVVTAFDAYLRPVIQNYIASIDEVLARQNIECELQIIQSRGGITNSSNILEKPISTILSGPAAAVAGAVDFASVEYQSTPPEKAVDRVDLITFDMGGTSCDVSLIEDGEPHMANEGEVQDFSIRQQMLDINTIGAGGGSIAWLDDADSLHVGPKSAGAQPGPACYQRGGTEPTVTDASLALGYLNPEDFAGGRVELDKAAAIEALQTVSEPLDYNVRETAQGIHRIINAKMAEQLRLITVKRGIDPRDFNLFAMGGAGPCHVSQVAERLQIPHVIVPYRPGVLSASGLLSADIEHDFETNVTKLLDQIKPTSIKDSYEELIEEGRQVMMRDGISPDEVNVKKQADLRYRSQSYEIKIDVPKDVATKAGLRELKELFEKEHERRYGHRNNDPVEVVTLRTIHIHEIHHSNISNITIDDPGGDAHKENRNMYFAGHGFFEDAPVYDRTKLPPGDILEGPGVIEQNHTTIVVYPNQEYWHDDRGNLIISTSHN